MEPLETREESRNGHPTSCWSGSPQARDRRHPKPSGGGVPLAIVGLLLTCTSLSVKAQVASNTAAQGQAAGGSASSASQINPTPSFNLTAVALHPFRPSIRLVTEELAALQGINPSELAAQTSANARLATQAVPAPQGSAGASPPVISNPNPIIAQALLGAYGVPPAPDLPASVGKPTANAAFVLTPNILKDYLLSQQQGPLSSLPILSASALGGYGRPGSAPGPAPAPQPTGRQLLHSAHPATAPIHPPLPGARGPAPPTVLGFPGSYGGLPPATAIAPGVYGVATAPGVYGVVGSNGVLGAYRQPGSVPPVRSLDTR